MQKLLFLLLLWWGVGAHAEQIFEPANPAIRGDWSYLSGNGLRAANISSGETRWAVLTGKHLYEPTVVADRIYIGSSDGLFAVDSHSGQILWQQFAGQTIFSPVVVENRFYAGGLRGEVLALSKDGKVLWQEPLSGWVYTPVWNQGLLVTGGSDQTLWGLVPESGEVRWHAPLDQELVFRPVATGGRVIATTFAGSVTQYDAKGSVLWRRDDGVATLAPLVANGYLLLAGLDGSVRVRDLTNGALIFRADLRGRITRSPLLAGDRVFLVSEAGEAAVFDLDRRVWQSLILVPESSGWVPLIAADQFLLMNPRATGKEMLQRVVFSSDSLKSMDF